MALTKSETTDFYLQILQSIYPGQERNYLRLYTALIKKGIESSTSSNVMIYNQAL